MGLTPAPFNAWPLAWIALVPLWILLVKTGGKPSETQRIWQWKFLGLPLLWGSGYHGIALFWITGIHPMTWLGVPWLASLAIASFCWTFITLWGAALVTVWAITLTAITRRFTQVSGHPPSPWVRVAIATALWCSLEALWSAGNLWWTALAYTQSHQNLVILHLGQLSGPTTITGAIVIVNGLIAEAILAFNSGQKYPQRTQGLLLASPIILFLILHGMGFALYNRPLTQSPETALTVGIIQGNIPNEIKFDSQGWRRALEGYTTGYQQLAEAGVDGILIPETAFPYLWTDENIRYSSFYQTILDYNTVAWVGTFGSREGNFTNSLVTVTPDGKTFSRYDKTKLVPLGEYIPFEAILGKIVSRLSPLEARLVAGKPDQVFDTPFGRAIAGICYDSAFSELFRRQAAAGGEFMLSASNDAHYTATMMEQHHAQDVMRAIETDRWAVRATNTGYSAIVNPQGKTIWISEQNTYQIHTDTIYRRQTQTLYVRWGDWLLFGFWGLAAIGCGVDWRRG
ncbi:apolipoprotein N-acyltransferase [Laspinema olomoucense]|uniref:apolipoprotein N-acyltransferase n=1 Tax=Laspinema olomoucense TaxID=3231600 RepID=UPI0021BB5EB9|nr:apolipoprotein N-acyltransferase [Laspinema sp. D3d]MCT7972781.1 apolipoprotein N-acyltransferase [Laspinema sp. D3d]